MELNANLVTLILFCSFLISGGIALYSQLKGYLKGQRFFTLMMACSAVYAFGATVESASVTIEAKIFWSKMEYIGVSFATLLLFEFVCHLVNINTRKKYRYVKLLYLIPAATLALVWTNDYHHLIWKSFEWNVTANNILIYHHGPVYFVFAVFSLVLILLSTYVLASEMGGFPGIVKKQMRMLIAGCLAPFVLTLMYLFDITPIEGLDLTTMSLPLTGIIMLVGIMRFGMFKIIPSVSSQITSLMPDGFIVVDENNDIVFFNRAAASMLNLHEKEFSYLKISEISKLNDITSNPKGQRESEIMINSDPERWLEVTINPIRNEAHQFKGNLIVLHDMTKRKRLEQQSRNLLEELSISHDQMIDTNNQKDRIIGIIAHDLRTTFHQVINLSEILNQLIPDLTEDQLKEYLGDLQKSAEQGYNILEELLEWARSQKGSSATYSRIEVAGSVKQVVESLQLSLQNKELTVNIIGDENLVIRNDNNVLNLVLRNLLINAIKFSNNKGRITVNLERGEDSDVISISDQGIGIPEADLPKLFNAKAKYTRTGTGGESGSGFGLLLCKEMIERNYGSIEVKSKEGIGSTFSIRFYKNQAIAIS